MRLSTRMRAVVALCFVIAIAMGLVTATQSFGLVLYSIAILATIAAFTLAVYEYLAQRH